MPGFSDAQFDLDTLRSRGLSPSLAEYFRHAPRFAPGDQPVQVTVNGRVLGRRTANFDASGSLCFTPAFVRDTGLVSMDDSPIEAAAVEAPCRDYRRFSPRTVVTLLPTVGSVDITVPPEHVMPDPRSADEERGGRGDRQAATELRSPRPTARPRSQDPFFDKPYEPDPSAEPSWEQKDAQASTASSGATTQSPGSALSRFIKPKRKVAALLGGSGTTRR